MTTATQQVVDTRSLDKKAHSVLISGASFAGLAMAWWMKNLGYSVTVVERRGGTPVNIRAGVIDVVRRMGLLDRIKAQTLPERPVVFLDEVGIPLRRQDGERSAEEQNGEPEEEYEIERDALLDLLFDEVKDDVEWLFANSIAAVEESAEQVHIVFSSGRKQAFSLVLGCDGTHSNVRRLCFGEEASFVVFLKNYFSLTIVPRLLMQENMSQMFSVPGKTVMLNTYNGKTDIAFCFSSQEEIPYDRRKQDEQKRTIRSTFEGGPWRVDELLDEMSGSENFYFDKLCQVHMSSWTKGRVALVGDAGYCPSPAAGMGGSVAILGAAALGEALAKHAGDLAAAFQDYEQNFRPVIEGIQAQAVAFGLEMFMPASEEAILKRNNQLGLARVA
jgi:2-polyprenyl-6-methoxyphenol hydroxylase-like FAD-dependent oxidoreductase